MIIRSLYTTQTIHANSHTILSQAQLSLSHLLSAGFIQVLCDSAR